MNLLLLSAHTNVETYNVGSHSATPFCVNDETKIDNISSSLHDSDGSFIHICILILWQPQQNRHSHPHYHHVQLTDGFTISFFQHFKLNANNDAFWLHSERCGMTFVGFLGAPDNLLKRPMLFSSRFNASASWWMISCHIFIYVYKKALQYKLQRKQLGGEQTGQIMLSQPKNTKINLYLFLYWWWCDNLLEFDHSKCAERWLSCGGWAQFGRSSSRWSVLLTPIYSSSSGMNKYKEK